MRIPPSLATPTGDVRLTPFAGGLRLDASDEVSAWWAWGWWHGRCHGDQAVLARDAWRSTWSSHRRASPAENAIDAFTRLWGFTDDLDAEVDALTSGQRARLSAYARGFGAGRKGRPGEEAWTAQDSALLARTLGFWEWWEGRRPLQRFLADLARAGLDDRWLQALWPDLGGPWPPARWVTEAEVEELDADAWKLVRRLRRFRPGRAWIVPPTKTPQGRPLLGLSWASDVTDPGLPLLGVRLEYPGRSLRGLGLPGMPAVFAGKSRTLTWGLQVAVDDTVDPRGFWVGRGRTGTLRALFDLDEAADVAEAEARTRDAGSAALDVVAVDPRGGARSWPLGQRFLRTEAAEAWLPPRGGEPPRGPRRARDLALPPPGRLGVDDLARALVSTAPEDLGPWLGTLRFLLPDQDRGHRLRRWSGSPDQGPEADDFHRLYRAVHDEFWAPAPQRPRPGSGVYWSLLGAEEALITAPHSVWLPSADKNRRLAEAVKRAFGAEALGTPLTLGARRPRALWVEEEGEVRRVYAVTVAVVADPGEPGWKSFLTDDETEDPQFTPW